MLYRDVVTVYIYKSCVVDFSMFLSIWYYCRSLEKAAIYSYLPARPTMAALRSHIVFISELQGNNVDIKQKQNHYWISPNNNHLNFPVMAIVVLLCPVWIKGSVLCCFVLRLFGVKSMKWEWNINDFLNNKNLHFIPTQYLLTDQSWEWEGVAYFLATPQLNIWCRPQRHRCWANLQRNRLYKTSFRNQAIS